jgi:uncharacterized protein YggL (DUF469 family)
MRKEWGIKFNQLIYHELHEPVSKEDMDYILDKFVEAVMERGLMCGGSYYPTQLEILDDDTEPVEG